MADIGLEAWHIWVILGILLFTAEIFVPGFVLASLGVGAFAGAAAHALSGELGWAIAGFIAGASLALVAIRPLVVRTFIDDAPSPFGAEGMKGLIVTITDADDVGGQLKTQFRDSTWAVVSDDDLLEGDRAEIIEVNGATLKVARVNKE
jgi:membrane protein implicated in regulation of membrane protease activity